MYEDSDKDLEFCWASKLLPLTQLMRKDQSFPWMEACKVSFEELKRRLTSSLVLILPNLDKSFKIYCNTSH
ncbi:hypothetical protein CR513_55552, partial [Mucuna pruriens]